MTGHDDDRTQSFVALTKGTKVSHYKIIEKIGAGGMGEVYLAEDTELRRNVALKFLPPHLCQDEECRERFKREAQAAAKLDHPNIVPVHEVGDFKGRPFFAMAHIEGQPLREVIKEGKLTISEAVEFAMQICEGLHKAHESGIVHRDIKPANIIIDKENRPRLLDFGLATVTGAKKLTKTGSTMGTLGYMSPEQIQGEKTDRRSDLFSVGVILYEMITGRTPFEGEYEAAVHFNIVNEEPEPLSRYKSGVTGELQQVIDKALTKDPSLRYQHADGIVADLKRLEIGSGKAKKSKLGLWVVGAVLAILGMVAIVWRPWNGLESAQKPDRIMLAVLPFENLGDPEDEYFADGITAEIMTRLSSVRDIGVIARASSSHYKGTSKSRKEIAGELRVDYILEGSIRWQKKVGEADLVRITPSLIETADLTQVWAMNFDRALEGIFDIQTEIADHVADHMQVALQVGEKNMLKEHPTENMKAYHYYLKGKYYLDDPERCRRTLQSAIDMLQMAIAEDPDFIDAMAALSTTHAMMWGYSIDRTPERLASLKNTVDSVLVLDDTNAEGLLALTYYHLGCGDRDAAQASLTLAEQHAPDNPDIAFLRATWLRAEGDFARAIEIFARALTKNPRDANLASETAWTLDVLGRYEKAMQFYDLSLSIAPEQCGTRRMKAWNLFLWRGDYEEALAVLERAQEYCEGGEIWDVRYNEVWLACFGGDFDLALTLLRDAPDSIRAYRFLQTAIPKTLLEGLIHLFRKEQDLSRNSFSHAARAMESKIPDDPENSLLHSNLGIAYAGLGDHDRAVEYGMVGEELMNNRLFAAVPMCFLARIYALVGEYELALDKLEKIMGMPQDEWSAVTLQMDPTFECLRDHPRFQALIEKYEMKHGI